MTLDRHSTEELLAEIKRRESAIPLRREADDKVIVDEIYATVKGCLDNALTTGWWNDDNDGYIFESAMRAFYGKDYFQFHQRRFK